MIFTPISLLQEGDSGSSGGADFSFVAHKSIGSVVKPAEEEHKVHKQVHSEVNIDAFNEIAPVANAGVEAHADAGFNVNANANAHAQPPVFVKEVSNWRGPHYNPHYFRPDYFQDVLSSFFRIAQRHYYQPVWAVPHRYNYIHQVRF